MSIAKKFLTICSACVVIMLLMLTSLIMPQRDLSAYATESQDFFKEIDDAQLTKVDLEGCETLEQWYKTINEEKASLSIGTADARIEEYAEFLSDEDKCRLREYEYAVHNNAITIKEVQENKVAFEAIVEDCKAKQEQKLAEELAAQQAAYAASFGGGGYYGGSVSSDFANFMRMGVVESDGYKFTYYSQSVLPGGGLNIPGRHVDGGFVKDADGYICVANSRPNGSTGTSPWGDWKVYDKGTSGDHIDVYVQ